MICGFAGAMMSPISDASKVELKMQDVRRITTDFRIQVLVYKTLTCMEWS
jgi:hypothetical protein